MQEQKQDEKFKKFSWFEDPDQIEDIQIYQSQQNFIDKLIEQPVKSQRQSQSKNSKNIYLPKRIKNTRKEQPSTYKDQVNTHISESDHGSKQQKSPHQVQQYQQNPKSGKQYKHNQYSKTYRQRKKQRYKTLQDENSYLKKRIKELQQQVRQQQIELNRFKFPPPEKQITIQEFRREFLERTVLVLNQHKSNPMEQTKIVYTPQDPFYHEFLDIYAQRGFAGSRKTKLLNYYFNQILEGMLKDSQRYLIIMFAQSKSYDNLEPLEGFEPLHAAFYDVFQLNQDLKERLKYFIKNLFPLHLQLNKYCSDFYKAFQNILACSQKIHNFINDTYLSNMDVARKRIQLETWFQFHKYGKLLRRLRNQWLDLIISGIDQTEGENKKNSKGTKRKKTNKQQI